MARRITRRLFEDDQEREWRLSASYDTERRSVVVSVKEVGGSREAATRIRLPKHGRKVQK